MQHNFEVGQVWSYDTMPGFESSRIVIGAIEDIPVIGEIVCITLTDAPLPKPDGTAPDTATIPFIPFAREALDESVKKLEGEAGLPEEFPALLAGWKEETEGEEFLPIPVPLFLDMLASGSRG